jgi:hypothetical protein
VRQRIGFVLAWVIAAVLAITVGVTAVNGLGGQIRDRGPIGNHELIESSGPDAQDPVVDPDEPRIAETFSSDFGEFVVACQGKFAFGVQARPDKARGWRTISYEPGPDDDIDAVFSDGRRSQELEVYCNLGRPVLSELENNTIPSRDD